ncbi:hypothetical protein KUCAC02_011511 [Chaenocephalus aceratus]|uniref:Uncharacterized protein n=1 Tax=Chaenocephalus aceratus TaxID=36190 RepID=A0ACB9WX50_CHAAC|nr:hypothetical protein KUCAC02_011511 [Chaenocephalus aceratus]
MEPGTSREIPNGSGFPEPTGPREETPGEEARGGMLRRRGAEAEPAEEMEADCDNEPEHQRNTGGEEELDPRIQDELEQLNQASDEINKLELQLDVRKSSYRRVLTDSARRLNAQGSQLGACIEKARPYYEARRLAKEAQQETQKAALRYERAVSMHTAAREMVYVAEQGLQADRNTLDPTWQEMLNHATAKVGEQATATESSEAEIPSTSEPAPQRSSISNTQVNEAEEERLRSEREHQRVTQLCQDAEARVQTLQKALKKVIVKSKPYFELKAQFNHILELRSIRKLRSISSSGRSAAQVDQQLRSIRSSGRSGSSGRSAAQVDQQLRSISSSGRSAAQVDQKLRSIRSSGRSAAQVDQQLRSIRSSGRSGRSAARVDQKLTSISSSGRSAARVDQKLGSISSSGRSAARVDQKLGTISSSGRSAARVDQRLGSISGSGRSAARVDPRLGSIRGSGRSAARVDQKLGSIRSSGRSAARVDQQLGSIRSSGRSAARVDQQLGSISSSGRSAARVDQQLGSIRSSGRSAAQVDQQLGSISPRQHDRTDSNPESDRAAAQAESK